MNLIDKDIVLKHLDMCLAKTDGQTPIVDATLMAIKCYIEDAPAVDAEPVRHGKWIEGEIACNGNYLLQCSECKRKMRFGEHIGRTINYCPNCGAKMDEVTEDA